MVVLVKDIMSKPVFTIGLNKTAQAAGKIMTKTRRGFLVVTKGSKPVGVISDSDLIKLVAKNFQPSKIKVKDVMKKPIVTINPDDDILTAVRKMKRNNIHRLPVVKSDRVVGVISLTDIARTTPEMLDLLEYRLKMKAMPFEIKEEITSGMCENCGNYSESLRLARGLWICSECMEEMKDER